MFVRTTTINKILKLNKRVRAVQGGTSSGKTFGIIPVLINEALEKPNLEISIVSESVPHLKRGVIKDFKKILIDTGRWYRNQWHGSDFKYTFKNGSYIEFFSADNDSKLRGARRDILYINECNNVIFEAYQELTVRTKMHTYLDWNPTHEFWFDEHVKNDDDVDFLIVTYKDNEACPQNAIDYILKAKEKAADSPYWENWYKVYGLGELGQLQGAIFTNWERGEFDESLPYCYGLDFGFSPDPSVMLKVAVDSKNRKVYIKQEFYLNELDIDELDEVIRTRIKEEYDLIVADGSEKMSINYMRRRNLNVIKANRDPGSVKIGYKGLMGWQIIICGDDIDKIIYAFRHHVWNDKKAGIPVNVEKHIPDCMRYAWEFLVLRKGL